MRSPYELEMKEHEKHITWMTKNGGFAKDMTMRDHFAGLAVQGMLAENGGGAVGNDELAEFAYAISDAMLKAREK